MVLLKLPIGLLHFVVGGCGVGGVYKSVRKKNLLRKKALCSRGGGSVSLSFVHPKKWHWLWRRKCKQRPTHFKQVSLLFWNFFPKVFFCSMLPEFSHTFLTWGNMSLCFRSSARCCSKGVEVHNTLFRCFSQLFSFRSRLAIFSIKAWNNIRRVVPPPFLIQLMYTFVGAGQISVAFHQSWCKMFCYKFFLHQMKSFATTCQLI